jgi:diadenosine tetraphosphate (Ap4A) HIT family hydrolase
MMNSCIACQLSSGTINLPGGRIYATSLWVVEHCIGALGVGTLMVKPLRHCEHVWELTHDESDELGPLLQKTTMVIQKILKPDQVYVCLWSHKDWQPGHIHFVLQPVWNDFSKKFSGTGPVLQTEMFKMNKIPPVEEIEQFAENARKMFSEIEC